MNLNHCKIEDHSEDRHHGDGWVGLEDHSLSVTGGKLRVYFRDLQSRLVAHISEADVIVGCVAWLTSEPILRALARKQSVAIVVQKEDFLRPDISNRRHWTKRLRDLYEALPSGLSRYSYPGLAGILSVASDDRVQPVRCVGNHNADRSPAFPRAHHKFVVFCRAASAGWDLDGRPAFAPYAAWTGSFNFTANSSNSLENAIYVHSQSVAQAFYDEWAQVFALSEPLDWSSRWVAPEWRIGT